MSENVYCASKNFHRLGMLVYVPRGVIHIIAQRWWSDILCYDEEYKLVHMFPTHLPVTCIIKAMQLSPAFALNNFLIIGKYYNY